MSQVSEIAAANCDALCQEFRELLLKCGKIVEGSGTLNFDKWRVDLHSCFGPPDQDKDENQDFVVGWTPLSQNGNIAWGIALADGVTSSEYSATAARIACMSSLVAVAYYHHLEGEPLLWAALDGVGLAIGALAEEIESNPDTYMPSGFFPSTWRYKLERGRFIQTTLTLAWMSRAGNFHVGVVGDGGLVIDRNGDVQTLMELDLTTSVVHAIGPRNQRIQEVDCWEEVSASDFRAGALFTDGIGRGLSTNIIDIMQRVEEERSAGKDQNLAELLVEDWIANTPMAFDDNLSLALITPTNSAVTKALRNGHS